MTPLPSAEEMDSIGCANLELRPGMVEKYLEWPAIHVDPEWKGSWFYNSNPAPTLPRFSATPPVYVREWILKYNTDFRDQVEELLERTVFFREMKVTVASILFNYTQYRIQPLQRHQDFCFQYLGTEDSNRLSTESMERATGQRII